MNTAITIFNTVTALGADCSVVSKNIILNGGQGTPANPTIIIPYAGIKASSGVVAPVTEVLQVTTGTLTGANSTVYTLEFQYVDTVQKKQVISALTYTSLAVNSGNDLLDEIANSFIAQIGADPAIPITPTLVSHTLVLTAKGVATTNTNGSQQFTVTNVGPGIIAFVTGTAAVAAVGLGLLYNQGATANANIVNTSYYYTVNLDFNDPAYGDVVMSNSTQVDKLVVLVLTGATDYLTLVGVYGTLTSALAGKSATWTASTGNPAFTQTTGVVTLTTDTVPSLVIKPGDVVMIGATTTSAMTQTTVTLGALSSTTLQGTNVAGVGAAAGYYVRFTSIL